MAWFANSDEACVSVHDDVLGRTVRTLSEEVLVTVARPLLNRLELAAAVLAVLGAHTPAMRVGARVRVHAPAAWPDATTGAPSVRDPRVAAWPPDEVCEGIVVAYTPGAATAEVQLVTSGGHSQTRSIRTRRLEVVQEVPASKLWATDIDAPTPGFAACLQQDGGDPAHIIADAIETLVKAPAVGVTPPCDWSLERQQPREVSAARATGWEPRCCLGTAAVANLRRAAVAVTSVVMHVASTTPTTPRLGPCTAAAIVAATLDFGRLVPTMLAKASQAAPYELAVGRAHMERRHAAVRLHLLAAQLALGKHKYKARVYPALDARLISTRATVGDAQSSTLDVDDGAVSSAAAKTRAAGWLEATDMPRLHPGTAYLAATQLQDDDDGRVGDSQATMALRCLNVAGVDSGSYVGRWRQGMVSASFHGVTWYASSDNDTTTTPSVTGAPVLQEVCQGAAGSRRNRRLLWVHGDRSYRAVGQDGAAGTVYPAECDGPHVYDLDTNVPGKATLSLLAWDGGGEAAGATRLVVTIALSRVVPPVASAVATGDVLRWHQANGQRHSEQSREESTPWQSSTGQQTLLRREHDAYLGPDELGVMPLRRYLHEAGGVAGGSSAPLRHATQTTLRFDTLQGSCWLLLVETRLWKQDVTVNLLFEYAGAGLCNRETSAAGDHMPTVLNCAGFAVGDEVTIVWWGDQARFSVAGRPPIQQTLPSETNELCVVVAFDTPGDQFTCISSKYVRLGACASGLVAMVTNTSLLWCVTGS